MTALRTIPFNANGASYYIEELTPTLGFSIVKETKTSLSYWDTLDAAKEELRQIIETQSAFAKETKSPFDE